MIRPRIHPCRRGVVALLLGAGVALLVLPGRAVAAPPDSLDVARAQGSWAELERLGERLAARASVRPDSAALARGLEAAAEGRWMRRSGRDDRPIELALHAAAVLDRTDPSGTARTRMRLLAAAWLAETSRPDSALALIATLPAVQDDSLAAEVHYWRGRALTGAGRREESAREHRAALALHERRLGPLHPRVAEVLYSLGVTATAAAEYDTARSTLARARRILERDAETNARMLGQVYTQLSVLERNLGDMAQSIDWAQRALQVTRRTEGDSSLAVARVHATIALRLLLVEDAAGAQRELFHAIPLLVHHLGPTHFVTLNNALYLAQTRTVLGDTLRALAELDSLEQVAAAEPGRHAWNLSFAALQRAQILDARGHRTEAKAIARLSLDRVPVAQDARGTARAEAIMALLDLADGPADRAYVDSLSQLLDRLADSTGLRRNAVHRTALDRKAMAFARVGATDAAWAYALEAERLGRSRLLADAGALPESQALGLSNRFGASLDALVWLAAGASDARPREAWDRLVRWRGLVRDEMARLRAPRAATPATLAAQQEWSDARRRVSRLVVAGYAERDDAAARAALDEARERANEAERRWVRASGRDAGRAADSVGLDDVLATLAPGEALVSLASGRVGRGKERLVAFVATHGARAVRAVDLGPIDALRAPVARWRERLATSPAASPAGTAAAERACRAAGEDVRRRVWGPIAAAIGGARRVDLVGEDVLADLPWLALPVGARAYLIDGPIAVRALDAERDRIVPPAPVDLGSLLAVGDPDFGAPHPATPPSDGSSALRSGPAGCLGGTLRLDRLPAAAAEAGEIASAWRASGADALELRAAEATEAAFKRAAPGRTVLHLATHGLVIADTCAAARSGTRGVGGISRLDDPASRPARPAAPAAARAPAAPRAGTPGGRVVLALAGAGQPPAASADENEGWLTAEEVVTLDLRGVNWVVLSACHSGVGTSWPREGALGMGRAFRLAGARAVVASRWAVEDVATREWMRALYAARIAGARDAADALRLASRDVLARRRAAKRSTHPFYWAAFGSAGG